MFAYFKGRQCYTPTPINCLYHRPSDSYVVSLPLGLSLPTVPSDNSHFILCISATCLLQKALLITVTTLYRSCLPAPSFLASCPIYETHLLAGKGWSKTPHLTNRVGSKWPILGPEPYTVRRELALHIAHLSSIPSIPYKSTRSKP